MGKIVGLIFDAEPEQEKPEQFICSHCGKEYKSAAALEKHVESEHPQAEE